LLDHAHFIELNLSSFNSVVKFVDEFKSLFPKLDILINNAAAFPTKNFELTEDKIEHCFQSNHLSGMGLSLKLLDYFDKKGGRILNLSSFAHVQSDWCSEKMEEMEKDLEFNDVEKQYYGNMWRKHYHYANTKLANIYFTLYLSEYVEKKLSSYKNRITYPWISVYRICKIC